LAIDASGVHVGNAVLAKVGELVDDAVGVADVLFEKETPHGEEAGIVEGLVVEEPAPAVEHVGGRPGFFGGDALILI